MKAKNVYLGCLECGHTEIEFPSADFAPDEDLEFECPRCGFTDKLLPKQTVASYAKEFDVKLRKGK